MMHAGLTGGVGSGKSAVAALFAEFGAVVLDADLLARELTGPGSEAAREIEAALGPGLLLPDGALNRPVTAEKVFQNPAARERLEAILHPRILARRAALLEEIRKSRGESVVVLTEAALIFEADTRKEFDCVLLVTAPVDTRLARLAARGMTREEALARMGAQWSDDRKSKLADFVVDNGGTLAETRRQAEAIWKKLTEERPS